MPSGKSRKREERQAAVRHAVDHWGDHEFGISLEEVRQGHGSRMRLRWLLDNDPYVVLMSLPYLRGLLDAVEREYVLALRVEADTSWEDLGFALGITGEAARRRHRPAELEYREAVELDGEG
jgi:hypothetical protein